MADYLLGSTASKVVRHAHCSVVVSTIAITGSRHENDIGSLQSGRKAQLSGLSFVDPLPVRHHAKQRLGLFR